MNDDRGDFDALQVPDEVEISQAFPYRLLHPADDPEGCQIPRFAWIREVTGDAELECALPVCGRILLLEPDAASSSRMLLDLRDSAAAGRILPRTAACIPSSKAPD